MPEIIWKRGAEEELVHIFTVMEDCRPGAGEDFTLKLDAVLQNLRSFPALAPMFQPPMRRLVIGNTGFGVFYASENHGIIIHALVHLSQHPRTIRERILKLLGLQ